jgi:ankyrin repeat protein
MTMVHLLESGADRDMQDKEGNTPLMYASGYKDIYAAGMLLDAGVHVNRINKHEETALALAVKTDQPVLMLMLIAHYAFPYRTTSKGMTIRELAKETEDPWMMMALSALDTAVGMGPTPNIPPPNIRYKRMISMILSDHLVRSYDITHPHLRPHCEYINTCYHPALTIKNSQGANPLNAITKPTH